MLALAPLVIITVAGFSLSNIYGVRPGSEPFYLVVVDDDRGWLARAIIDAIARDHQVSVVSASNLDDARAFIGKHDRAPLCVLIPPDTTASFETGSDIHLIVYIDPVKRLEAAAIELDLDRLCRMVTSRAHQLARTRITEQATQLRGQLIAASDRMKAAVAQLDQLRRQFEHARVTAQSELTAQTRQTIERMRAEITLQIDQSVAQSKAAVEHDLAERREALVSVVSYLEQLQASQRDFEIWLTQLRAAAGSHANQIPPPPDWPAPPGKAQLAELSKPIDFPLPRIDVAAPIALSDTYRLPRLPKLHEIPSIPDFNATFSHTAVAVPGIVGWQERSITGGNLNVNAFDQYVPGFGITFLLMDMFWGVGVGLIDERDWGTLARLHVSGASASGLMLGKLTARFLTGLGQMILLFGAGRLFFGISLGSTSWALLFPAAAISFAAAAFSLVIACIANTRDAVLPIGAMTALVMSAIGGCWWPLDFEPYWMRAVALGMPTTWTMVAFNNLMIRGLDPSSVVMPAVVTSAIGVSFLAIGILGSSRIYRRAAQ